MSPRRIHKVEAMDRKVRNQENEAEERIGQNAWPQARQAKERGFWVIRLKQDENRCNRRRSMWMWRFEASRDSIRASISNELDQQERGEAQRAREMLVTSVL